MLIFKIYTEHFHWSRAANVIVYGIYIPFSWMSAKTSLQTFNPVTHLVDYMTLLKYIYGNNEKNQYQWI